MTIDLDEMMDHTYLDLTSIGKFFLARDKVSVIILNFKNVKLERYESWKGQKPSDSKK